MWVTPLPLRMEKMQTLVVLKIRIAVLVMENLKTYLLVLLVALRISRRMNQLVKETNHTPLDGGPGK